MGLDGQVAIVTGAASGIGRAIAIGLAERGAQVVCGDVNRDGAQHAADELVAKGRMAAACHLDVVDGQSVADSLAFAARTFACPDILVNAAGILRAEPMLETTLESFRATMDVNVYGLLAMLQGAAKMMLAAGKGGRIINIASIAGRRGEAVGLQYCASKAAVISVTQSAALALATKSITVNAIAPGFIQTGMWRQIQQDFAQAQYDRTPDRFNEMMATMVPIGRLGVPEDLVGMAAFLASRESAYVTGQTFNVDGGFLLN